MTHSSLITRYDGRVPRYTSYPTAPHFRDSFPAADYATWLAALPDAAPVSIYLHVPFCDRLCLYCGCNTTVVRRDEPRRAYAALLLKEIEMVAAAIGRQQPVSHVHWGGGTPTTLPSDCLTDIMDRIRARFALLPDAEIAIEVDPTALPLDRLAALDGMGVTRASVGVQDLEPAVQAAIGRHQSFEITESTVRDLRSLGINSLNLDLIYGLPNQTEDSVTRTARKSLELGADRVAVFGYAHVPWMKKHQALIPDSSLPGPEARFVQREAIDRVLTQEGGYRPVGLDHYAKPGDSLADAQQTGAVRRNFQGYTTDTAEALIGIGASSIGCLPQGYVQNATKVTDYTAALRADRFAIARGVALSHDDRVRRAVIERIMCDLRVDLPALAAAFGADPAPLLDTAAGLGRFEADGLILRDGGVIEVTQTGRPFVRNVAAEFDAYLVRNSTEKRHSQAV